MNAILQFADAWQTAIWRASWQGSIALCVAWIVCQVLRRAPAAVRCWVWRLAYLKMLVALFWADPVQIPLLTAPRVEPPLASPVTSIDFSETPGPAPVALPAASPRKITWTRAEIFLCVWLLGLAICLAGVAKAGSGAHRLRKSASPCEPELIALFQKLFPSGRPALLCSDSVDSPLLIGPFRPAIVLPRSVIERTSAADLRLILAHELAHAGRHDLAWDWLAAAVAACFFFHPLVWLAQREWRLNREIACDELARSTCGASAGEYGHALVNVVSQQRQPAPSFFALGIGRRSGAFRRRIKAMKNASTWSKKRFILTAAALAIGTLIGTIPWQFVAAEPPVKTVKPTTVPNYALAEQPTTRPAKTVHASGAVTAATIELRAPVDGQLRAVAAQEGKAVKRGDLLFEFDARREQAALDIAKAQANVAEASLRRVYGAGNTVSNAEREQAEAEVQVAKAKLRTCEIEVTSRRVEAPLDGVVTEVDLVPGQYVPRGTLLTTIVNNHVLKVDLDLTPEDVARVKLGEACQVYDRNQNRATGKIIYIAPRVSERASVVRAKALVTEGADHFLPGMFVSVQIGG